MRKDSFEDVDSSESYGMLKATRGRRVDSRGKRGRWYRTQSCSDPRDPSPGCRAGKGDLPEAANETENAKSAMFRNLREGDVPGRRE